jgi:hypothetical protein
MEAYVMAFKVYYNELSQSKYGLIGRYKAGNTGRDRSTPRGYTRCFIEDRPLDSSKHYGSPGANFNWRNGRSKALTDSEFKVLYNNVLSKLEGKCGAGAQLGSSIFAEGRESVQQAVKTLEELASIAKAMRRKDITAIRRAWKRNRRPTAAMKSAGGRWLEFSFGWAPLVQTVFDGMKATTSDYPPVKLRASSNFLKEVRTSGGYRFIGYSRQRLMLGCKARVTNPNTWLLGRLDFLNPAGWLYEAVPGSFFVDYFVNLNQMIGNLSSFAGITLEDRYMTLSHHEEGQVYYLLGSPNGYVYSNHREGCITRTVGFSTNRVLTWQQNPLTSSWRRGANASAFLAQFMRRTF